MKRIHNYYDICELCGDKKPRTDHKRCKKCASIRHGLTSKDDTADPIYYQYATFKHKYKLNNISLEKFIDYLSDYVKEGFELHFEDRYIYPISKSESSRLMSRFGSSTGYQGVYFNRKRKTYFWQMVINGRKLNFTGFISAEDAAKDRDKYIIDNDITARLSNTKAHYSKVVHSRSLHINKLLNITIS